MDLKSFYKKIDVDSIKNKLPPIKIPKIKSRKIFKSSREDLAQQQSPVDAMSLGSPMAPVPIPGQSSFIDRTPTRISTVSSLMNINYGFKDKQDSGRSTYKTANNFEEENCPDEFDTREPVAGNSVGKFGDKCKKTYKDFQEFKIKNIFAKKTVVKRTEIEVDIYARQYERDNYLEEQDLENQLEEDGYAFEFKNARQRLSISSGEISPPDSDRSGVPSPIRSELAHLQNNDTPPLLAKRRNAISEAELKRQKFQRSVSSESNDEPPPRKPNRSSLWGLNEQSHGESGEEHVQVHRTNDSKLSRFKKSISVSAGESGDDQPRITMPRMGRFKKQSRGGLSVDNNLPTESEEDYNSRPNKPGISRMARFKKSVKDGIAEGFSDRHIPTESGDDQPSTAPKSETSRIARFKKSMKEGLAEGFSDKNATGESGDDQPKAGPSRMARFKKSMKDGIAEGFLDKHAPAESGEDQQQPSKLSKMAKFKKSMTEGLSEGFSDKHTPAESGEDQPPANKTSRMARFKKSMKAPMSEGISDKNVSGESGDEHPQAQKGQISRMARFKKSMKDGISDRHIPEESGDEQPSTHKAGTSRMSRLKASMLEGMSDKNVPTESGDEQPKATESRMSRFKKSMKEGMSQEFDSTWNLQGIRNRFTKDETVTEQKNKRNLQSQESLDEHSDLEKKSGKLSKAQLRRGESTDKNSEPAISSPEGKFSGIKMSINRLKSRKHQRQTSEESEIDLDVQESPRKNMSDQLKAGLRRLKKTDRTLTLDEEESKTPKESTTSRLQNWKKSIKLKRPSEVATEDNDGEAPPANPSPLGRSHTLMRKLKQIRSRTVVSEDDADSADPSQGNDQPKQKSSNLEKLDQARAKALQKVNAQVQKMKNFHGKSKDLSTEESPDKPNRKTKPESSASRPLPTVPSSHSLTSQLSLDDNDEIPRLYPQIAPRRINKPEPKASKPGILASSNSMESTISLDEELPVLQLSKPNKSGRLTKDNISKPIILGHSHSMDDDEDDQDDEEDGVPRVFLHQDNSDSYESTLTVAVTRRAPPVPTALITPKAKYLAPKTEWIPNKNAISSFLEMTPSPESSTQQLDTGSRGHLRKRSMDSNDSDSWIPDNFRNKSCSSSTIAGLNKISENTEPWKVHSVFSEEKLYKARSIDIFANRDGGAFKDFDDEMKNVPVRRIGAESAASLNKSYGGESSDDDDYDNASKVTRVKYESPMVSTKAAIESMRSGNSYESTESNQASRGSPVPTNKKTTAQIGNSQESLDANYDENDEISSEDEEDEEDEDDDEAPTMAPSPPPSFSPPPPPLPLRKPPRLVPERNDSMVRLAHPLVKQGSLRRHFSEEIEPADLGKVNKLITRFEKNPTYENVPRIQLIPSDDDDGSVVQVEEPKVTKTKENDDKKRSVQYSPTISSDDNLLKREKKHAEQVKDNGAVKKHQSRNGTSDEEGSIDQKKVARNSSKRRPAPIPNQPEKLDDSRNNNEDIGDKSHNKNTNEKNDNNKNSSDKDDINDIRTKQEHRRPSPSPEYQENLDNVSIQSPNSIYGSPIGSICLSERISTSSVYGSPIGVSYPVRTSDHQMRSNRRLSNRSSLRDDDTFYSFESDEENNFYSLGDSSDMRYVIEI
ncbi:protein PIP82 [Episyrphus balteatus]|uniref:protein PIP82 n=1 Tax=Episyrphus balteatus TaxID=286459 RepID=UPI0024850401|nr:protein PIP82 [Episyrphus balteatus]